MSDCGLRTVIDTIEKHSNDRSIYSGCDFRIGSRKLPKFLCLQITPEDLTGHGEILLPQLWARAFLVRAYSTREFHHPRGKVSILRGKNPPTVSVH